jgi:hypothetical protein
VKKLRAPRPLDDRSKLAVEGVLSGKGRAPALMSAGYAKSYAERYAGRFFNRPEIRAALAEGWAKIREKSMYTVERAMAEAEEVIQLAKASKNAMAFCKAVELRSRLAGHLDMTLRVEHVNIAEALSEARRRTIPWNEYRQIAQPVDPFED